MFITMSVSIVTFLLGDQN